MSSSRALRDVTRNNGSYEASAVGEVNVVDLMKRTTPIGGEGNGGIIYPSRIMVAIA
jgi:phosphomannomutase